MEKNVRKSRNEVREKESEIAKLKETKEQSAKTIEELKEVIKQNESNANNLQKQITGISLDLFNNSDLCSPSIRQSVFPRQD